MNDTERIRTYVRHNGGRTRAGEPAMTMDERDWVVNTTAEFLPMTNAGLEIERPCVFIGGVMVYAYVCDGRLIISVDTDTRDDAAWDDDRVPYVFRVDGIERDRVD